MASTPMISGFSIAIRVSFRCVDAISSLRSALRASCNPQTGVRRNEFHGQPCLLLSSSTAAPRNRQAPSSGIQLAWRGMSLVPVLKSHTDGSNSRSDRLLELRPRTSTCGPLPSSCKAVRRTSREKRGQHCCCFPSLRLARASYRSSS